MDKYLELEACRNIVDAAVNLHPYSKDPQNPETYSQYNEGWTDACNYIWSCLQQDANFEDFGSDDRLTPEYFSALARVSELLRAVKDGRLLVLPCKVGDTVYKLCPISPFLEIGDLWGGRRITGDCDRCPWGACDCHDIGPHFDGKHKNIVHEMTVGSLSALVRIIPYFGSIYFLTYEDAEAALKELEVGNEG